MADVSTAAAPSGTTHASGPVFFARFAFPPNQHGYCGPTDADGFFSSGVAGDDVDLRAKAADFDGALPFLQLIADCSSRSDPLDRRVVESYWLGGPELEHFGSVESAVRDGAGSGQLFASLSEAWQAGALPHHSFVVFCVYPWVTMLGDERRTPQAMKVLDGCRIRSAQVLQVDDDLVTAESRPLTWDGRQLSYGSPLVETVRWAIDGRGLSSPIAAGDWVALHWDWVCDRITDAQRGALQAYSDRNLSVANGALARRLGLRAARHDRSPRDVNEQVGAGVEPR